MPPAGCIGCVLHLAASMPEPGLVVHAFGLSAGLQPDGRATLQLVGLGWDMVVHAAAGEPLDLWENPGHLVAMGGIILLAVVVALPSLPDRFRPVMKRPTRAVSTESESLQGGGGR